MTKHMNNNTYISEYNRICNNCLHTTTNEYICDKCIDTLFYKKQLNKRKLININI